MAQRPEWKGFYYDGRTADRQEVTLTVEAYGLRLIRPDGTSIMWPYDALRQTQGSFSSEQIRIETGQDPVEVVLVNQPGFAAAVRAVSPEARRVFRPQRDTARILVWGLGVIAAAVMAYAWGAPAAAAWLAPRLPPEWEMAMGKSVAERMATADRVCGDSASLAAVHSILDRLVAAGAKTPYQFRMVVLRDTSINAFAAPGGFIGVHSGLLAAAKTPEEFAGVLSHEIQHVTLRHSTRAIVREVPVRLAIASVTGGGLETAASLVTSLGALSYRRGDESEADREGMRLLQAAQVDPSGAVAIMRTLQTRHDDAPRFATYLMSHPSTADRVAQLEALSRQSRHESRALLDSATWDRVRRICSEREPEPR